MNQWEKEWQTEQERVNSVVEKAAHKIRRLEAHLGGKKVDVVDIRKNFWEDVTVNLEDADEAIETAASIKQQAELLSELERSHKNAEDQMKSLVRLSDSPYFGRIDFKEKSDSDSQPIYLGIASFYDEEKDQFLVYDWRAPISSLYYDYSLGKAEYEAPGGVISGEMELKRQYIIRNAIIKSMFDTGVTIGDELLQEVLSRQANPQMKSIVATIQKEQNQIIRNTKGSLLIVQGAAGCGKTSAALQRVAYLLYRYRETLTANQIVLFSPNNVFNSYVSNVLPELGEENMMQTTFQQYIHHHLGSSFHLEDPLEQMEAVLTAGEGPQDQTRLASIQYKASLDFMDMIEKLISRLRKEGIIFKPIKFRGKVLIPAEEIKEKFYSYAPSVSIPNRMKLVSEWLVRELRKFEKAERNEPWVEEKIQLLEKDVYVKLYQKLQKKKQYSENTFNDFEREQKLLSAYVVSRAFKPLKKRIKALTFINLKALYMALFKEDGLVSPAEVPSRWKQICLLTAKTLAQGELYYEDATPFLYLKERMEGFQTNTAVRHVFIDEAQDYSPFQFAFIQRLFPRSKMTVLGDLNQSIYAHSTGAAFQMLYDRFGRENTEQIILTRSYRSTRQIVEFTRELLDEPDKVVPFNRDGEKPVLKQFSASKDHSRSVADTIAHLQNEKVKTIAVICKTEQECKEAYEALKEQVEVELMLKESSAFKQGTLIIPSYLAKGIEFDAVLVYDASNEVYGKESERKLFYTVCTRAMHELHLFAKGDLSPFFERIPEDTFHAEN
ncbi:DNA helicase-2 / ATP-dependent DNA helicase PcrA [Fictibacillus enclensis]|uniref:DNA 3'-5' helicase n=1 Tax=Fictibacillus enclensis TaxID=1017270 RepID=A0A0V8JBB8_9BACL|nr:RNA polymerase recycling motor HelD [Fictibacillus enclensis]KSU84285.1 helicase [Fictibacillus enclensis]SCB76579.1 DNA helicase-2 / ATP-dependent DNA helicase PcrA [Fictibacillus enclensis]